MVYETASNGGDLTVFVAKSGIDSIPTNSKYKAPITENGAGCFQDLREEICRSGLSEDSANVIIDSWHPATRKQYGAYLHKWLSFCREEQIDQFSPSINCVIMFLTQLFKGGLGYSGINTAKSAVSSVVNIVNNIDIGNNHLIKKFMKGVFNRKPCLPRLSSTWAVSDVLKYLKTLSPVEDLSLKLLSYKLVVLLALTTGQRIQTIHSVDLRNVVISDDSIKIRFGDLLKQTRVGNHLAELYIEAFPSDEDVCVVKTF